MLKVNIPGRKLYDESKEEFIIVKPTILQLEHSLLSLSQWESRWHKPFLSKTEPKTDEETLDYIRCMTINKNINEYVYYAIPPEVYMQIKQYIDDPMTATWFKEEKDKPNRRVVTAEVIYYWMIANNIPVEFQKWHLNRLLVLIRVCSEENAPKKKRNRKEMLADRKALNEQRRKQLQTKG